LLDSRSVTGAYKFVVTPGVQTTMQVEARLFMRQAVEKLGIAPLTSMFFHGENTLRRFDDFRPEVHDSDGLLMQTAAGEWLWRPLDNPERLHVSAPQAPNLKGFGLLQRDRLYSSYEDLEARSELRPSAWVAPQGAWGEGTIELIEIPTKSDVNDNIVAMWRPQQQSKAGDRFIYRYTLSWFGDDQLHPPDGRVVATRRDYGTHEDAHRFVIDFAGKKLAAIPADQVLRAVVTVASGPDSAELLEQQVVKNPVTQGWRLTFQVRAKSKAPVELRAFLDSSGDTLTETWSSVVQPW
jgi:periplasmic glucans biosynthesis protein